MALLLLAAAPALGQEEEEAVRVHRVLAPSVVSLRSAEDSGAGLLLDGTGLILTNAHVVSSPLPYTAQVDARRGGASPGAGEPLTFAKVEIVGFHPVLDLALVRIDPAEHGAALTAARLATGRPAPGQRVYAIGDPGGPGLILTRTITSGILSATDRALDGQRYLQFSAPINPGNSGGPLADRTGAVLGLVTLKVMGAEGIGLAIPLDGLDVKVFVPFTGRRAEPERARALRDEAARYARAADELARRVSPRDEQTLAAASRAAELYREALAHDPASPDLYHDLGTLLRRSGAFEAAAAYLVRGIQIAPWDDPDGGPYRELAVALMGAGKREQARIAWLEGLAKFPYSSRLNDDMAMLSMDERRFAEAAYLATVAGRVPGGEERYLHMRGLRAAALARLSLVELRELEQREAGMVQALHAKLWASDAARAARTLYMTPAFAALVLALGGPEFPAAAASIPPRGQPRRR